MADVFISYHRSDDMSDLVRNLARELEDMGISCWYDTRDTYYDDFVKVILSELKQCRVFLALLDDGAQKSNYVRLEINNSFPDYGKTINPIFLKIGRFEFEETLYARINHHNIPSYDSPKSVDVGALSREIVGILGNNPPPDKPSTPLKIIDSGECGEHGDNVTYTLDEVGQLVISGVGPMSHYRKKQYAPWYSKRDEISDVYIQKGVTSMGNHAFALCRHLKSVSIPDSVASIGDYAFAYCSRLTSVHIPESVTSIGNYAFWVCGSLKNVNIPDSVKSIGDSAFAGCGCLTKVRISDSVLSIGDSAFYNCGSLTSVHISNSVTSIGVCAFQGCKSLGKIRIPDSVSSIGASAFRDCSGLTSVRIPDSVMSIGDNAFSGCANLTGVSVPAKAEFDGAFESHTKVTRRTIWNRLFHQ
ncbi:MAG: leucine-rich repeat protein [Oscillibacter sp.]|nr:leucine-rich repeat protein [Oscillibacter sp.]